MLEQTPPKIMIEKAELLLVKNPKPRLCAQNKFISSLHVAVERRNWSLVELLVDNHANLNVSDFADETPPPQNWNKEP